MATRRRVRREPPDVVDLVRRVGAVLDELRLTEAEVTLGDVRVRVQRTAPTAVAASVPVPTAGAHAIWIESPGHARWTAAVQVNTNKLVKVSATLEPRR